MKRFLCTTAFMIALAMLFILGPGQSVASDSDSLNERRIQPSKTKFRMALANMSHFRYR